MDQMQTCGEWVDSKQEEGLETSAVSSQLHPVHHFKKGKPRNRCWLRLKDLSKQTSLEKELEALGVGSPISGHV